MAQKKGIQWDDQPLGEVPDRELARRLDVSVMVVNRARRSRGIPQACAPSALESSRAMQRRRVEGSGVRSDKYAQEKLAEPSRREYDAPRVVRALQEAGCKGSAVTAVARLSTRTPEAAVLRQLAEYGSPASEVAQVLGIDHETVLDAAYQVEGASLSAAEMHTAQAWLVLCAWRWAWRRGDDQAAEWPQLRDVQRTAAAMDGRVPDAWWADWRDAVGWARGGACEPLDLAEAMRALGRALEGRRRAVRGRHDPPTPLDGPP